VLVIYVCEDPVLVLQSSIVTSWRSIRGGGERTKTDRRRRGEGKEGSSSPIYSNNEKRDSVNIWQREYIQSIRTDGGEGGIDVEEQTGSSTDESEQEEGGEDGGVGTRRRGRKGERTSEANETGGQFARTPRCGRSLVHEASLELPSVFSRSLSETLQLRCVASVA
jgi:hypothetical protein